MKKKILIKENTLLKFLLAHIFGVCNTHINATLRTRGEKNAVALNDYVFSFNIHSFINYFLDKYGDEIVVEPDEIIIKEAKDEWNKFAEEIVLPDLEEELDKRKELYECGECKEEPKDIKDIDAMYQ